MTTEVLEQVDVEDPEQVVPQPRHVRRARATPHKHGRQRGDRLSQSARFAHRDTRTVRLPGERVLTADTVVPGTVRSRLGVISLFFGPLFIVS